MSSLQLFDRETDTMLEHNVILEIFSYDNITYDPLLATEAETRAEEMLEDMIDSLETKLVNCLRMKNYGWDLNIYYSKMNDAYIKMVWPRGEQTPLSVLFLKAKLEKLGLKVGIENTLMGVPPARYLFIDLYNSPAAQGMIEKKQTKHT